MIANDGFEKRFTEALAAVPEIPDCYGEISRRIKKGNANARAIWGIAAMLAISLTSFFFLGGHVNQSVPPEVAEEIQSIDHHMSGDDIREELVSNSLIGDDIF